jgi:hypothetical protein
VTSLSVGMMLIEIRQHNVDVASVSWRALSGSRTGFRHGLPARALDRAPFRLMQYLSF